MAPKFFADTRGSVAASAQRMASALVHDDLVAWSTPTPGVPVFDPARFVTSEDTLILLTQDAAGSGAAFVSNLVYAVFTAAQQAARRAGGRLRAPLVADLDEVGNVVKLKQLPEWYSFFRSMGIVVSAQGFTFTPEELVDWAEGLVVMLESVDWSQNQYWCPQWWKHPEAVDRLRALYQQWLEAHANGGRWSWWIDHYDRQAIVLSAKRSPVGECGTRHTDRTARRILAIEQPPPGWAR